MTSPNARKTSAGRSRPGMILRIPSGEVSHTDQDCPHIDLPSQRLRSLTARGLHLERGGREPRSPPLPHRAQPAVGLSREGGSDSEEGCVSSTDDSQDEVRDHGLSSQLSDLLASDAVSSHRCEEDRALSAPGSENERCVETLCPEDTPGSLAVQPGQQQPVMKRKTSLKDKSRGHSNKSISLCEQSDATSQQLPADGCPSSTTTTTSSASSAQGHNALTADDAVQSLDTPAPAVNQKRRISFAADSVLTAVIQDGDTTELVRLLTGRQGPGLVMQAGGGGGGRRGEAGVGVDAGQTNHAGLTALHQAVLANNEDAAKLLLCHGADVNAQDVHGFSPLHTAAACGFLPIASLLLLFGADVFSLTAEHELPVDVAGELSVVRLLSTEMVRVVQQELWVTAALRAHVEELWVTVRKLLACLLLFALHLFVCLRSAWRGRHRKSD